MIHRDNPNRLLAAAVGNELIRLDQTTKPQADTRERGGTDVAPDIPILEFPGTRGR